VIQVRKVQPNDLEYLARNAKDLGYQQSLMVDHLENMMVILDQNEICGIGFYTNYQNRCLLNWIHIKGSHRRNGFGTMLVKTMLNIAEQQGALQAYMEGSCSEFANFLGFRSIIEEIEIEATKLLFKDIYRNSSAGELFKVSLIDYFKPCCHQ
jgi:N-acetylglutamate synthase-like GNAT family acetyltransferase